MASGRNWDAILQHAATIVRSYSTRVTLRQLFYRLVADQTLRNTRSEYGQLSARTAQARRDGWFPALISDLQARIRACQECGKPFLAESYQTLYCSETHAGRVRKRRYRERSRNGT